MTQGFGFLSTIFTIFIIMSKKTTGTNSPASFVIQKGVRIGASNVAQATSVMDRARLAPER